VRIVITGALGHIGSRLIRELPAAFPDAEIVLVDNLATQRYSSLFDLPRAGRYRFRELDVLTAELPSLFEGAQAVVHLAAMTDAMGSVAIRDDVERVNYLGTEKVARACIAARSPLLFASTTSVYGVSDGVVDEDCPDSDLRPQSPYAESKLRAERLLALLGHEAGLRFVSCRLGTVFGVSPGMRFHTAINKFCWQAVHGEPMTVWRGALGQQRPYLELGDAVAALIFALHHSLFDNHVYNVVTLNSSIDEVIGEIRARLPGATVRLVDSPIMNQLSYRVSSRRFTSLGFEFTGQLRHGIGETLQMLEAAGGRTNEH
jgi:nucleoside-diphosphate-sugar epimerase